MVRGSFPLAFHRPGYAIDSTSICKLLKLYRPDGATPTVHPAPLGVFFSFGIYAQHLVGGYDPRCRSTCDRLAPLFPSCQLRYLHSGKLSHRPTIALFLHGLFYNVLHLRDRAVFPDEFSVPITKAAVGLTLAPSRSVPPPPGSFESGIAQDWHCFIVLPLLGASPILGAFNPRYPISGSVPP